MHPLLTRGGFLYERRELGRDEVRQVAFSCACYFFEVETGLFFSYRALHVLRNGLGGIPYASGSSAIRSSVRRWQRFRPLVDDEPSIQACVFVGPLITPRVSPPYLPPAVTSIHPP